MAGVPAKKEWSPEQKDLIERVLALGPAAEPFYLSECSWVEDPVLFHKALEVDIDGGPDGPRARTGALMKALRLYFDKRTDFA